MENKEKIGSPSSFTNDLFGAKESAQLPASSAVTGIFSSIFPPPSTVLRRNSSSEIVGTRPGQSGVSQSWNRGTTEDIYKNKERSSIFQGRAEPCPLSSSIHYGGQEEDMYTKSSNSQTLGSQPDFKKDGEEDDQNGNNSHGASRGNWWQGSLYY